MEEEISLADYVRVLWERKWIVLGTFLAAIVLALLFSYLSPKQYQVQTALLVLPPLSQEVGGQVFSAVYSPEFYKSLALAGDLLEEAIKMAYGEGGGPTVAGVREGMKVEVKQVLAESTTKEFSGVHLRVTFTGSDREKLVAFAQAWAEKFIAANAELFLGRTAQFLTYVNEAFAEAERNLRAKQEELKKFLQESQEPLIQREVEALKGIYSLYLREFAEAQQNLVLAQEKLASLEQSLAEEPQYFVLVRSPSNEDLWQFLGSRPGAEDLEAYSAITVTDQTLNSTYVSLRHDVASARAEVASWQARLDFLQEEIPRIKAELEQKQAWLLEVQTKKAQLEDEIELVSATYKRLGESLEEAKIVRAEPPELIRIVEAPVLPTTPIGPNKKMNVAVAGVLGLFVGVLLAFVANYAQEMRKELKPPHSPEPDRPAQDAGQ